jgi:hypothetical protein
MIFVWLQGKDRTSEEKLFFCYPGSPALYKFFTVSKKITVAKAQKLQNIMKDISRPLRISSTFQYLTIIGRNQGLHTTGLQISFVIKLLFFYSILTTGNPAMWGNPAGTKLRILRFLLELLHTQQKNNVFLNLYNPIHSQIKIYFLNRF